MKTENELIAEFMDVKQMNDSGGVLWDTSQTGKEIYGLRAEHLRYDSSWDWLMPVVEKISRHVYETFEESNGYKTVTHTERAYPRTFGMIDNNGKWMVRINRMPLECEDTLIKATYQAVVEWIKAQN